MRQAETISPWQFMFLMLWLVSGSGLIVIPNAINYFVSFQDGWIVAAVSSAGVLIVVLIYMAYVRVFSKCAVELAFTTAFGKWIGRACVLWIMLWILLVSSTTLREWSVFIETNFFPTTPYYILTLLLICLCSYSVYNGLEVMARMAQFISPVVGIVLLALMLLPLHHAHFAYLRPVLSSGWSPVVRATVVPITFYFELILSVFMASCLKQPAQGTRYLMYAGLILVGGSIGVQVISIVVLGITSASMQFAVLEAVRSISYGEFLQRLDPFYVSIALAVMFIKLSVFEYVLARSIQSIVRSKHYRHLVWGAGGLIWAGSISFFRNTGDVWNFVLHTFPGFTLSVVLVVVLAISVGWARQKRQTTQGALNSGDLR